MGDESIANRIARLDGIVTGMRNRAKQRDPIRNLRAWSRVHVWPIPVGSQHIQLNGRSVEVRVQMGPQMAGNQSFEMLFPEHQHRYVIGFNAQTGRWHPFRVMSANQRRALRNDCQQPVSVEGNGQVLINLIDSDRAYRCRRDSDDILSRAQQWRQWCEAGRDLCAQTGHPFADRFAAGVAEMAAIEHWFRQIAAELDNTAVVNVHPSAGSLQAFPAVHWQPPQYAYADEPAPQPGPLVTDPVYPDWLPGPQPLPVPLQAPGAVGLGLFGGNRGRGQDYSYQQQQQRLLEQNQRLAAQAQERQQQQQPRQQQPNQPQPRPPNQPPAGYPNFP